HIILFILMLPPPPCSTLFPYTTLFRSKTCENNSPTTSATGGTRGRTCDRGRTTRCITRYIATPNAAPHDTGRRLSTPSHRLARRSEEHTSELQSLRHLVCRLLLEKKKI